MNVLSPATAHDKNTARSNSVHRETSDVNDEVVNNLLFVATAPSYRASP